jgi:predicted nucleic acid-binding protein
MDDLKARNMYARLGLKKKLLGTVGVLKFMLTHGILKESVDAVITKLGQAGFRFKKDLFKDC